MREYRWWRRVAAVFSSAVVTAALVAPLGAGRDAVSTSPIDRVHEIRERFLAEIGVGAPEGSAVQDEMVQWYNWGNFPNWPNWPNWGNFPNY